MCQLVLQLLYFQIEIVGVGFGMEPKAQLPIVLKYGPGKQTGSKKRYTRYLPKPMRLPVWIISYRLEEVDGTPAG